MKGLKFLGLAVLMLISCSSIFAGPVITSISPNFGPVAGGTVVTITGSGFTGVTAVDFGAGNSASFTFIDDNHITATSPVDSAGAEQVSVTVGVDTSPFTQFAYFTYQGDWLGYVDVQSNNSAAVFDAKTHGPVTTTITGVAAGPRFNGISPTSTKVYVPGGASSLVSVINIATNTITATVTVGSSPNTVATAPNGLKTYVTNEISGSVSVIDTSNNTVIGTITVGTLPLGIAITPDGSTAFVCNFTSNNVSKIDLSTNSVVATIPVGTHPQEVAITPNGAKAYVTDNGSNAVSVIDIATNTVTSVGVGAAPQDLAITPDGLHVYVENAGSSSVSVIDTSLDTVTTTITGVGNSPAGIAITPDGGLAYVTSFGSNDVIVIDTSTNTIIGTIVVGSQPLGIAITPDQAPVALFTISTVQLGTPTTFDASMSNSPTGTIVSYFWDFGDGNTLTTASPIVTHTYATTGNFTVTLTVTNSAGTSTTQVFTGRTMNREGGPTATFSQNVQVLSPLPPPIPLPPSSLSFQVIKKKCHDDDDHHKKKQKSECCFEYTHILAFKPSPDPTVVAYRLVRNGRLIKTIPASGPFVIKDKRGKKNRKDTYVLTSVNAMDRISTPIAVVIPKQKKKCKKKD